MRKIINLFLCCLFFLTNNAFAEKYNLIILTTEFVAESKFKKLVEVAKESPVQVDYRYVENLDAEKEFLTRADFVILDAPRSEDQTKVDSLVHVELAAARAPIIQINRFDMVQPLQYRNISAEHAHALHKYYVSGMDNNRKNMLEYIGCYLSGGNVDQVEKPRPLPEKGIYHPAAQDGVFTSLEEYLVWWESRGESWQGRPVIAMETTSSYISDAQTAHLDAVIQAIEDNQGLPVVFYPGVGSITSMPRSQRSVAATVEVRDEGLDFPNPRVFRRPVADNPLLEHNGKMIADVLLVNTFLGGDTEGRKARYQKLGIPVLQVLHYRGGNRTDYLTDLAGIDSYTLPFTLTNAEYIGIQDPVILTTNEGGEMLAMPEQLELLIGKAFKLAVLQNKKNSDKKLALLFWNHPPGEKNQGASNMNVPRSLEKLSKNLQAAGYQLDTLTEQQVIDAVATMLRPAYRSNLLSELMATEMWAFLPLARYQQWFAGLPASVRAEMNAFWGDAADYGGLVEYQGERGFVIPRLQAGNLIVMPQPGRGGNDPDAERDAFHDVKRPMHHYFAAVYLWIRESYQADAIIHFGTHGTQEWHPGKERGLWAHDAPNLAVGTVPVIYPYIVDNIGEAIHVKRRGRGVIVSHQTPPFSPAGLSDDFVQINNLLMEYHLLDEGLVKKNSQELIIEQVVKMNIHQDMHWNVSDLHANFDDFSRQLEDYLEDLGAAMQPLGLHTFGQSAEPDHLALTLMLMLQEPLATALELESMAAEFRMEYEQLQQTQPFQFVYRHILQGEALPAGASAQQQALVQEGRQMLDNLRAEGETAALLRGLEAGWIDPSYGGDPVRNPDALPTGRNVYGFDPSRVPTRAAYAAGVQALDELLLAHQLTHQVPLQKLAFTLWSAETMRHLGMLEAQILAALGVRPVWDRGGRVEGLELIPLSELKRPRIDTVISLTGLYRDQFPPVIERLNEAIALVAAQDEPPEMNLVRANTQQKQQELLALGYSETLASTLALTRIFSSESGDYGTKLPDATLASDQWDADDGKLASLYLSRMSWGYGPDPALWSQKAPEINGQSVNLYAEQLKGTQAVVFSRSSNLRGMLDTDHPFEFLGGISLAVQHLDGVAPQLYISNLRDPNRARLQTAERFMATELRSVYQHPNWLQEMQKEGYAGTLQLLNTINNFWGWQVMDENVVRDDQWEEFHQVYINDKYDLSMREWFEQANPTALAQIAERMLEAIRKDYWDAGDSTKRELVELYQELAEQHDVHTSNATFQAYVTELAVGYGLSGIAPEAATTAMPESSDTSEADVEPTALEEVSGQQMKEITQQDTRQQSYWWLWLMLVIILLGTVYQRYMWNKQRAIIGV